MENSKGQRAALRRAINRYTSAAIEETWKGASDLDDYEPIEQNLAAADKALRALIKRYLP